MSYKVLVVDDEPACILFLGTFLKDNGMTVETSKDGGSAMALAAHFVPDILITDWMLKDTYDGLDVACKVLEYNPNIRIIFITGMASESLQEKISGIPDYKIMEKPVNLDSILLTIHNWK